MTEIEIEIDRTYLLPAEPAYVTSPEFGPHHVAAEILEPIDADSGEREEDVLRAEIARNHLACDNARQALLAGVLEVMRQPRLGRAAREILSSALAEHNKALVPA